jgi:pyruvate/2-oxoglutarate dehydrogenase complex dihydrolipoamide dehydrogenase (E3) component
MNDHHFDVIIIGGGQAGPPLAQALAKAGKRVALAERKHLGGSCVNFGCTPTKAVLASARVAHLARRGAEFGLKIPEVEVDFAAVLRRAKSILQESRKGLDRSFESEDGPTLLRGHARLTGKDENGFNVRIGDRTVTAKTIVLNTGTRSLIPPIDGLEGVDVLTAENWLEHETLPEHLAILGGGYIGLEMGQFYRRMGGRVTVIEGGPRIASREDEDVAETLRELLEREGIDFRLDTKLARVEKRGDGLSLVLEGEAESLQASHLLVATGRRPNTDDLGLDSVGIEADDKGFVKVDERLATSVTGIWAAGDIRGGPMFTHTSWDDYRVLEAQLLGDRRKSRRGDRRKSRRGDGARTTERIVPYAMFTDPELGRVGMSEREARASGKPIKVAKFAMKSSGKAREIGEPEGFVKVIIDAADDKILGATVLAAEGAELVHVYIDLMNAAAPYTVVKNAVHIHPTLSEALQSVFKELEG